MRIPYIINKNSHIEYDPSQVTKELLNEVARQLQSEDIARSDSVPPTLICLCLKCISNHFEDYPLINDLMLCADRDYLLEILPDDLPLTLTIPLIDDEIYWSRIFYNRYGVSYQHLHQGWTWRCIYLENHMQELIENAQPELNDEECMEDVTTLLNPYIHRLLIAQLQSWKPPLSMTKEDIPDVYPFDHINLEPIFRRLVNIQELDIMFGAKNVGEQFRWTMFKVSLDDMRHLGKALLNLKNLKSFRLHNSNLGDAHIQILIKFLIKVPSLEELNISNCLVGDNGALCIAKLMMCHESLIRLILANNLIGGIGGEAFGYALMQETCCPIKLLNVRLNPLGHKGVMGIFRALVRVQKLEELIISGCCFGDETSIRLGAVLQLHQNLKAIDFSNNWCQPGENDILNGLMINSTIQWLDCRETDISKDIMQKISKKLRRNRIGEVEVEEGEEEEGEEEEEDLEEELNLVTEDEDSESDDEVTNTMENATTTTEAVDDEQTAREE